MSASEPVDVLVNPNDSTQWYVLWGAGRIDNVGGCPAASITTPNAGAPFYSRTDQPVCLALWITDWTTGAGYVLDKGGGFQQVNGAPSLGDGIGNVEMTAHGLPYTGLTWRYVDWSWNPDGSGKVVVVDLYGQLWPVNGAPTPPRTGPRWPIPAAKRLQMDWTSGAEKAITLDFYGGLQVDYAAVVPTGYPYWPGWDAARDLIITDWSNSSGYELDLFGGVHAFGTAGTGFGGPYKAYADVARCLAVVSASDPTSFLEVWSGGQTFQWDASTAPTVTAGAGVSEVQTVTISGAPTGGTFTLTFGGQTTAAIAYNATAATVQADLQALSSIGSGNATVSGNAGGPWTVSFVGALAMTSVAQMTATSSLTGGTSPTVTVATTTDGVTASPPATVTTTTQPTLAWAYSDAEKDSQGAWQVYVYEQAFVDGHDMTDPSAWASSALASLSGIDPAQRGAVADYDLPNGSYRMYVRAQDTSGLWSAWSSIGWTQDVATPATPTGLTATPDDTNFSVALSVTCATGGTANIVLFEASDDGGATWQPVRGADAVALAATTTAADWDAPLGTTRAYRATAFNTSPRVASAPSTTASATLAATSTSYVLTSTADSTLGGAVSIDAANPPSWTRTAVAGVFEIVGSDTDASTVSYPTVVSDGAPKARKTTLTLIADTQADWELIEGLAASKSTLVYRDPWGEVVYCRLVGDWGRTHVSPVEYMHTTSLPLVEVAPPTTLAVASTVPPGPTQPTS